MNEKIITELDGSTLKINLSPDVLQLILDAHMKHIDTSNRMGAAAADENTFVTRLFLKGGLEMEMPFREWLKERIKASIDYDDFRLEQYQAERADYCDECNELLENCVCDEDEV